MKKVMAAWGALVVSIGLWQLVVGSATEKVAGAAVGFFGLAIFVLQVTKGRHPSKRAVVLGPVSHNTETWPGVIFPASRQKRILLATLGACLGLAGAGLALVANSTVERVASPALAAMGFAAAFVIVRNHPMVALTASGLVLRWTPRVEFFIPWRGLKHVEINRMIPGPPYVVFVVTVGDVDAPLYWRRLTRLVLGRSDTDDTRLRYSQTELLDIDPKSLVVAINLCRFDEAIRAQLGTPEGLRALGLERWEPAASSR